MRDRGTTAESRRVLVVFRSQDDAEGCCVGIARGWRRVVPQVEERRDLTFGRYPFCVTVVDRPKGLRDGGRDEDFTEATAYALGYVDGIGGEGMVLR